MAGIALIVLPALCYDALTPFPGVAAVPPVLGTVMLLGAGSSLVNRRVLGAAPMRFFGLISYSLYLWHWPLISLSRMVLVHEPTLPVRLGLLAIAVALAWASYRYIEQPFRHGRVPAGRTLWRFAGAMGLVAALTGSAVVLHGYPQRWPASYLAMSNTVDEDAKDPCLVVADATPRLARPCVAPGAGRRMVAVVGDSHAAALAPGIRVLAERAGLGVAQLTKASCPFLVGVSRRVSKLPGHFAACARFDRRVLRVVRADQRIGTVIIAGAWRAGDMRDASYAPTTGRGGSPDELLERGLSAAVAALRTSGKQVVIVRDVPYIRFMPKKRLAACASRLRAALNGRAGRRNCDVVSGDEMERDAPALAVLDRVASETGAILVDPRAALCDGQTCRIALDGRPLYRDQQHLTRAGAVLASAAFADALTAGAVKGRNRLARSPPIAWRPR